MMRAQFLGGIKVIKKQKRGTQVSNKFFLKANYLSNEFFEEAVKTEVKRLNEFWWLYDDRKVGIIILHRNKHGARVVAYNNAKVS